MNVNTAKLLVVALALCGCKDTDAEATPSRDTSPPRTEAVPVPGEDPTDATEKQTSLEPPATPPVDPTRSAAAAEVAGKAVSHLGFSLEKLKGWFSIEGRAVVPSWAAGGDGDPEDARDDDLRTAWTCTPQEGRPCVLGLSFSEPAKVHAIRLYGAAGPDYNSYRGHPRIRDVRIHTDAGWIDATIKDGAAHGYVVFDAPIESRTLAVEVAGTHDGRKSKTIHLAELEVLGTAGPRRAPLDLDPSASAVIFETEAWASKGEKHTIRMAFLEAVRPDGTLQRLLRATSLLGRKGDRFLLIEKLHGSSCGEHDGSYILLDQHTRMLYPLGTMGGVPGRVLRHDEGQGFAVRPPTQSTGPFRAVVLEDGAVKIKYSPKQDDRAAKAQRDWGFASEQEIPRGGGHRLDRPPEGCKAAALDDMSEVFEGFAPTKVLACALDESHTALVATGGACIEQWSIAVMNDAGEVLHRQGMKQAEARGLRLARLHGAGLVVEASRAEGASADLFVVRPEGIELLAKGGTLALRPPASCDPCEDRFTAELEDQEGSQLAAAEPSDAIGDELPGVDDDEEEDANDEAEDHED
jgi:hypothetical protein